MWARWARGWARWPIRCKSILILLDIPIWPSAWGACSALNFWKISTSLYFPLHHRILAQVAHVAFHLVPRLSVHSAGGSRKGEARTIVNLLIVWLATGLWHGASENFVLWGLYYFVLLVLEKTLLRRALAHLPGWCAHGYALFFVVLGWMLFYFESLPALGAQLSQMFSLRYAGEGWLVLRCLPMLAIGGICSTPWGARLVRKGGDVGLAILFLLGVAAMVSDSYNPFLYFRF